MKPLSIAFILSFALIVSCKDKTKVASFFDPAKIDTALRKYLLKHTSDAAIIDSMSFRVDSLTDKVIATEQAYYYKVVSDAWSNYNDLWNNLDKEKQKKEIEINAKRLDSLYILTLKDAETKDSLTLLGFRVFVNYSYTNKDGISSRLIQKHYFMTTSYQVIPKSKYLNFVDGPNGSFVDDE